MTFKVEIDPAFDKQFGKVGNALGPVAFRHRAEQIPPSCGKWPHDPADRDGQVMLAICEVAAARADTPTGRVVMELDLR